VQLREARVALPQTIGDGAARGEMRETSGEQGGEKGKAWESEMAG
jgi:hypothetical protein